MNRTVIAVPVLAVAALGASACSHLHSGDSAAAKTSASAAAKALATDPAALKDKAEAAAIAKKCLPVKANILVQVKYGRTFVAGIHNPDAKGAVAGRAERAKLSDCAGIPESQRAAFYDALKTSAVTAAGDYLKGNHKAIRTWVLTTVPETAVKYQKKS
jgi:hypothetical protein